VKRERGKASPSDGSSSAAQQRPSRNAAFTDDDDSPLVPILIGLGCAALIFGGTWLVARRYV
jgi:hypothetical protein